MTIPFLRAGAFAAVLLLAGCMSGPRPYDGVLGYRAQPTPTGFAVSYVDEADVPAERHLRHVREACARALGVAPEAVVVQVTGESRFRQDVDMSVAIPVTTQGTGSSRNTQGGAPGVGTAMQGAMVQQQGVVRSLALRRSDADCRKAP